MEQRNGAGQQYIQYDDYFGCFESAASVPLLLDCCGPEAWLASGRGPALKELVIKDEEKPH
jgi:hypothetical protein